MPSAAKFLFRYDCAKRSSMVGSMRGLKVCVQLPQGVPEFVLVTPYQVSLECKFRSCNQNLQGRHQFDEAVRQSFGRQK